MLMKALYTGMMVAGLAVLVGCNTSSTTGGSPGGGTFKLEGPATSTTVKHGGTEVVDIKANEDKNFKEDVALSAAVDPDGKGVTASLDPTTIKAGDPKKAKLTIKAKDEAADGDYKITVTGKPTKGQPTSVVIKVSVPKKK